VPTPEPDDNSLYAANTAWIKKGSGIPVNTYYTQYPATDASGNPVAAGDTATEFPASQAPASLFGGTWIPCFENESVFFRSGGKNNLSTDGRSNGKQGDASRTLIGNIAGGGGTGIPFLQLSGQAFSGGGALVIGNSMGTGNMGSGALGASIREIGINAANDPNFLTAGENRPVNRRTVIWKKTAMAV
jgi:hypothetical protein